METTFKHQTVTRQQIIAALNEFARQYPDTNAYDDWLNKGSYKFAVRFDGRLYPPKQILSMATGISTSDFSGGEQTNRIFRELGFDVGDK